MQVKHAFLEAVKKLKVGNPFDEDTFLGPMISESAAKGIEEWIHEAVEKGGKLLAGGHRSGSFVEPTVLENVPMEANARKEEIFGPVVLLYSYKWVSRLPPLFPMSPIQLYVLDRFMF